MSALDEMSKLLSNDQPKNPSINLVNDSLLNEAKMLNTSMPDVNLSGVGFPRVLSQNDKKIVESELLEL